MCVGVGKGWVGYNDNAAEFGRFFLNIIQIYISYIIFLL